MKINLLPRKSFVEKRIFLLVTLILLLLLAQAYWLWNMYLLQHTDNLALQLERQQKATERVILLSNKGWNEEVKKYEDQVLEIKRYQLLADSLQHIETDWTSVLQGIQKFLPDRTHLLSFTAEGNHVTGTVSLPDIAAAARFMEQMRDYAPLRGMYLEVITRQAGNEQIVYQVDFSAYLNTLF